MMENLDNILLTTYDDIIEICLNRPEKRNALNYSVIKGLHRALDIIEKKPPRVLLMRGSGTVFCSGADINWLKETGHIPESENLFQVREFARLLHRFHHLPIPFIIYVHGASMGGANGLVAVSDFCIAEKSTNFAFSEVKLGITPSTIMPYILKRVAPAKAKQLMLTGNAFQAAYASQIGLVDYCVTKSESEQVIKDTIKKLKGGAPEAQKEIKELIRTMNLISDHDIIEYTSNSLHKMRYSSEGIKRMQEFIDKRLSISNIKEK